MKLDVKINLWQLFFLLVARRWRKRASPLWAPSFSNLVDERAWCFGGLLLPALAHQMLGLDNLMPVLGKTLAMTCTRHCYPMPCKPTRKRWSLQESTYPLETLKMPHETWPQDKQRCRDKQMHLLLAMAVLVHETIQDLSSGYTSHRVTPSPP